MARPLNIQTFKNFFVSLRLPYSVQRGEQISVIATVFNYGEFEFKVRVLVAIRELKHRRFGETEGDGKEKATAFGTL